MADSAADGAADGMADGAADGMVHAMVDGAAEEAAGRGPRVLGVCIGSTRRGAVRQMLADVVAAGGSAVLLTADGAVAEDLPDGVRGLDLVDSERMLVLHRLFGRSDRVWRAWVDSRWYRAMRPWALWRALRRRLDEVDPAGLDHIVIVGIECWPIVWQLSRRRPGLGYGWNVPEEAYARAGREPSRL